MLGIGNESQSVAWELRILGRIQECLVGGGMVQVSIWQR